MDLIVAITRQQHTNKYPRIGEFYKAKSHSYFEDKYQLIYQVDPSTFEKLPKQYVNCSDKSPLCLIPKRDVTIVNKL